MTGLTHVKSVWRSSFVIKERFRLDVRTLLSLDEWSFEAFSSKVTEVRILPFSLLFSRLHSR